MKVIWESALGQKQTFTIWN